MLKHLPSFSTLVSFSYIIFSLCSGDGYSLAVLVYWGRRHFPHFESQIARSRLISPAERLIRLALLRLTYIPLRSMSSSIVTLFQPGSQNIAVFNLPKKPLSSTGQRRWSAFSGRGCSGFSTLVFSLVRIALCSAPPCSLASTDS